MTVEQLTQEYIKLAEHQAICDVERQNMLAVIDELKEDVKSTKTLTEDVHIMAINLTNMQKTLNETNNKVEELTQKDYNNYINAKKVVKQNIISGFTGAAVTVIITVIGLLFKLITKGG